MRERSRYTAAAVFVMYALEMMVSLLNSGASMVRILFAALLLSNLRATSIAAQWKPESEEAIIPERLGSTLGDKLADRLPSWLWPKARIIYYILSGILLLLIVFGPAARVFSLRT